MDTDASAANPVAMDVYNESATTEQSLAAHGLQRNVSHPRDNRLLQENRTSFVPHILSMMAASRQNSIRLPLPGILLAVICLVPFLDKAYTIDDPLFLIEARQILKTPMKPWSFPVCWMTNETCVQYAANLGPLPRQGLMGYVLVPAILSGGREWQAHLFQIVFVCWVVIGMVRLTLRLGFDRVQAMFAGVLVVAIPPLLSMASTAMPDVLALALGLTGIERLLAWKDGRRWHQGITAGVALGLAPYARPHLALFLPLGALWLFDDFKIREGIAQFRRQMDLWAPIFIAVFVLVAVNLLTGQRDAGVVPVNTEIGPEYIPLNLFAYFHYLSFPIPLAVVWLAVNWRKSKVLLVPFSVPIVAAYFAKSPPMTLVRELQLAAMLYGCAAVVGMIYACLRTGDRMGKLLTFWVLMPLAAMVYIHLPIKYMVAVLPAIVLILVRLLSCLSQTRAQLVYGTIVVACVGYSFLLLRADADFAEYGRKAALELIAPHVAAGEKVWYGGEWGFYWYAQEAGARISKPGEPGPNPGELLAVGLMEGGDSTLKRFPNRELIDARSYDSPHGRSMGYGAGLHSNTYGFLPWTWNPAATNDYQLWRVH